ncbi:MAG: Gfo/Idh/MocA family oxidoreductase [Bacteroidales bacterium]
MQIKWGIIGCGSVCEVKSGPAFYLCENSELAAVMRRNKAKAQDFATRHKVKKWYTNADQLINDNEVNAVYIATPPDMHSFYAIRALDAGKPVYVEKPMALNYQQCRQMIEASIISGIPLFVAYYRRFFPYFIKIKDLLDKNTIGNLLLVNLTTVLPAREADFNRNNLPWHLLPEISGGGYFFDLACHQLDILNYLLGPVDNATGWYTNRAGLYNVEDTVAALLHFKSGITASCAWTYVGEESTETDRIEIFGTKGKIGFSISASSPIELTTLAKTEQFDYEKPKHVEMPMIAEVVKSLSGTGGFTSNMESAAHTSWVMDKIMNRI